MCNRSASTNVGVAHARPATNGLEMTGTGSACGAPTGESILGNRTQRLKLGRRCKSKIRTHERKCARIAVIHQEGSPELSCVRGAKRMTSKQSGGTRSNGENVGDFVPGLGEVEKPLQGLASLRPRYRSFTDTPLNGSDDLSARPRPSDYVAVLGEPSTGEFAVRL